VCIFFDGSGQWALKNLAVCTLILYDDIQNMEKNRRSAIFILFLLPVLILSTNCFAESNWHLIPTLTVSETYDDNIDSTPTGTEDYITRIGADLSAIYNGPDIGLQGTYLINLNTYARQPKENVLTHDGNFNINLNRWFQRWIQRGELTVTEDLTLTPDLRDYYFDETTGDIGSLSSYGIRTRRSDAFRNAFSIAAALPITRRVNFSASYSNLLTEHEDPEFRDNITNTAGFGIGYAFPKDNVYSNFGVSNIREEREDSNSYSLVVGVRHTISPATAFDINTGVVTVNPETGSSSSTLRGGLSLTKRSRGYSYNAGYSRSLNTVSGVSSAPTTADIFYINRSNIHSDVLTSTLGANYAINRSLSGNEVDVHSYNISGSLNYAIRKWLRSSLTASHFNQESEVSNTVTTDIQRNMITIAFVGTWN